ncbi:hypothetical protein DD559_09255 [Sphingomonas pokkalii]|uniref:GS catalytic domain-containing protein n=1 Tax=Sphingomonas pokkalii TaxID=2175090 RepID=A0A2U0SDP3_9SPHN|nr:hypothetical protein DD559_09255 [Sphingomonas pokkalii]
MFDALECASGCQVVLGVEHEYALRPIGLNPIAWREAFLAALGGFVDRVVEERHPLQVEYRSSLHRDVTSLIAEHDETVSAMRVAAGKFGLRLDDSCVMTPTSSMQVNVSLWEDDSNVFCDSDWSLNLAVGSPLSRSLIGLLTSYPVYRAAYCPSGENCVRRHSLSNEDLLFVPRYNVWSVNNRAAAYRVCYDRTAPAQTRIENRVPCSSADLAICLSSTLASMLAGWENDRHIDLQSQRLFGFLEPNTKPCEHLLL